VSLFSMRVALKPVATGSAGVTLAGLDIALCVCVVR
jgi:hypothetical protein